MHDTIEAFTDTKRAYSSFSPFLMKMLYSDPQNEEAMPKARP
jgi:hypothetical protein